MEGPNEAEPRGGDVAEPAPRQDLKRATRRLGDEVDAAATLAVESAGRVALKASDVADRTGQNLKRRTAGGLSVFAHAVRSAGDELAQREPGPVADVVRQAARGIEDFAGMIERTGPQQMLEGVRDFARRNPMTFVGGSVLAGFALGRLIVGTGPGADPAREPALGDSDAGTLAEAGEADAGAPLAPEGPGDWPAKPREVGGPSGLHEDRRGWPDAARGAADPSGERER